MSFSKFIHLEKKFISKKNRFKLGKNEIDEIRRDFKGASFLVTGAAGSIGRSFINSIISFNFENLFLLDKDENGLTELNREINLISNLNKVKKIQYICSDLSFFDIKKFIINESITHYMNFAAVKHVRSEENLESIKYMIRTNSDYFLPFLKINQKHKLKKIFSVSTDKVANPTSILGISKKLMEYRLFEFKKRNPNIFVSSARFANVSFSNGSILKHIVERSQQKQSFGIPEKINRYFITHEEASSLCLKSLLEDVNGNVLIPNKKIINKMFNIKDLCEGILSNFNLKPKYNGKQRKDNNHIRVYLSKDDIRGQKEFEEFNEECENVFEAKNIKNVNLIKLESQFSTKRFISTFKNIEYIDDVYKIVKKSFASFQYKKKSKKVSKLI